MKILALAAALPLIACSVAGGSENAANAAAAAPASGSGGVRSFAVTDFTGVDVRGFDDVDVRVGAGFSVRAEGPSDQLDKLVIEKRDAMLRVGRRTESGITWEKGDKVAVYVTMPRIEKARLAGSGNLTVDRAEGAAFDASLAGSGDLKVAALAVDRAEFSVAGSGNVATAGTADAIAVSIAGSGDLDARGLVAKNAEVSVVGSGNLTATVDGAAKVTIMGSGDVDLGDKARCSVSKMGSGSVRCGN